MIEEDLGLTELIKGIKNNGHQEQWSYSWKLANKEGINLKKMVFNWLLWNEYTQAKFWWPTPLQASFMKSNDFTATSKLVLNLTIVW